MSKKHNTIWENEIKPHFDQLYHSGQLEWWNSKAYENYLQCEKDYFKAKHKYEKHQSQSFYRWVQLLICLSIFLLFIPLFWLIPKYNKLKNDKDALLKEVETYKAKKLQSHIPLLENIYVVISKFKNIMPFQNKGPVTTSLIENMQLNSMFKLYDYNEKDTNSSNTSWAVFNNKIIINVACQTLTKYTQTYHGRVKVADNKNNSTNEDDYVLASFDYEAYAITNKNRFYTFLESCNELEFAYDGLYDKKESYNKKNDYTDLENDEFNSLYHWKRNNKVQFRMIFTPHTQEQFLNEANSYLQKGVIKPKSLQWKKITSFLYNNHKFPYDHIRLEKNFKDILGKFIINADMTAEQLKNNIYERIVDFYYNIYSCINFMYITTLMSSEDQTTTIRDTEKKKLTNKNVSFVAHYILNEFFNDEIIKIDTPCYNTVQKIHNASVLNGNQIYKVMFRGLSFKKEPKVKIVKTYSAQSKTHINVPIDFFEYVPKYKDVYLTYCEINKNYIYDTFATLFKPDTNIKDQEILKLINELEVNHKVVIKNKIIAILSDYDDNHPAIKKLITKLM